MDINQMREELASISLDTSTERRRDRYQAALISTLLDVAESLRVVAAESAAAMQGEVRFNPETITDEGPGDGFAIGDVVYVEHIDGPGEVKGFGSTEGKAFAVVDFAGTETKVWIDALHLLTGDEGDEPDPLAEVIIEPEERVSGVSHIADEPDGYELPEEADEPDPDTDFDEDPLERLKAKSKGKKKAAGQ